MRRGRTFSRRSSAVLVPFPFSDLSQSKLRPAVCLVDAGRGDWVLCQITSSPYGDPSAVPLGIVDFSTGGLLMASFARPGKGKLFTASSGLIVRSVGSLSPAALARLLSSRRCCTLRATIGSLTANEAIQ
jgi:mRNA interferase MazF